METLKAEIRRECFVQHLIKRNERVAMYDVCLEGEIIGYEVFIIREQLPQTMTIRGKIYELKHKELFPRNEDFGYTAYAPSQREKAEQYYKRLTDRMEMRARGLSLN